MEMKDLVLGAAGNCEVCNNKKTEGYLITEPGAHPFWVCPECFKAYRSLKKKLERIGAAFPTGRNIQKAILLRRDYLAALVCRGGNRTTSLAALKPPI